MSNQHVKECMGVITNGPSSICDFLRDDLALAILLFIESTNQVKSINSMCESGKLETGEKCFPFSQMETSFVANGSENIKKWLFNSIKDYLLLKLPLFSDDEKE